METAIETGIDAMKKLCAIVTNVLGDDRGITERHRGAGRPGGGVVITVHDIQVMFDAALDVWKVLRGRRTLSTHRTQASAIRAGKREAARDKVELVTHGLNGRIRSKDSYGDESPRKDTEH